jgi:hypothetical protein
MRVLDWLARWVGHFLTKLCRNVEKDLQHNADKKWHIFRGVCIFVFVDKVDWKHEGF